MLRRLILGGAACAVLFTAPPLRAGMTLHGFATDLEPKTYASQSGEWTLSVDPSRRSGAGPATYTLRRRGAVVWSGERPFTFWDAAVADDGSAGGYAYGRGYNDMMGNGDFRVALLDAKGGVRVSDATPRIATGRLHHMPGPKGVAVIADSENDRFVVPVSEAKGEGTDDVAWWTYRLSDGAPLGKPTPFQTWGGKAFLQLADARAISGTPLTLVLWLITTQADPEVVHARFALVDPAFLVVWQLDLPHDYDVTYQRGGAEVITAIRDHRIVLGSGPRRFELRHVADSTRVSYMVERSADGSGWSVRETARAHYAHEAKQQPAPAPPAQDAREIAPTELGTIVLGGAGPAASDAPIREVADFAIDDRGRLGFLRGCGAASLDFVLVDASGALVQQVALPAPGRSAPERRVAWAGGDRWVASLSGPGDGAPTAFSIDSAAGTFAPASLTTARVRALAATREGAVVVVSERNEDSTVHQALDAFDRAGRPLWSVPASYEDETALFDPADVAVTSADEIAVLETVGKALKFYDRAGKYRRTVDLAQAWGREPSYPTDVRPDSAGGVVVYDFDGEPPVVRMRADGSVAASFHPAFADGRRFDVRGGVSAAPDGRLWSSDGNALLRLDQRGVVDLVLGAKPDTAVLGTVAALAVAGARFYAADQRTGAIHVFDAEGKRLRVLEPAPDDYDGALVSASLTATADGEVYVSRNGIADTRPTDFLHYTPDGLRAGVVSVVLDEASQDWYAQPRGGRRWILGHRNVYLVDAAGAVLRRIERASDGAWLASSGPASVAPGGAIALMTGERADPFKEPAPRVALFSADGEALASWPAPEGACACTGALAFDGQRLVFRIDGGKSDDVLLATDTHGRPLLRLRPARRPAAVFLAERNGATELWLYDGRATIDRYALP